MASCFSYRLVVVILCVMTDSVVGALSPFNPVAEWVTGEATSLTRYSHSNEVIPGYVTSVLSTVIGQSHPHLRILYDLRYEGDVHEATKFAEAAAGAMTYVFENTQTALERILTPVEGPTLLMTLCSPAHVLKMFRMIHRQRLDSHYVDWLVMLEEEEDEEEEIGEEVAIGLEGILYEGTRVVLVTRLLMGNTSFSLLSSYVDIEGVVRFYDEGEWDMRSSHGRSLLTKLFSTDESTSYMDMEGRELKVAAVNNFGLCNLKYHPDGTIEPSSGIDLAMVKALSQALNFTIRLVNPPDGAYGNPLPNGTVTGMIGLVARREAHFATCSISFSSLRETVIDFPYPYFRSPLGLFSRAPKQKNKVLAILSPFTLQVWICLVVATLSIGPMAAFQSRISGTYMKEDRREDLQLYSFNLFRSLVVQGNRLRALSWSQRLLFYSWYLFCIIFSALYSGMLTAVLAIPAFEKPIDFLEDLPRAVREGFDIGVYKDTTNEFLFREAKDGIYADTWKLFNHENPSKSFVKGNAFAMESVLERDFVYIGFMAACEILSTKLGRSKIHIGRETFFSSDIGLATPPGVPYTKIFGEVSMRLVEAGLRSKFKKDELRRLSSTVPREAKKSRTYAITLTHLQRSL